MVETTKSFLVVVLALAILAAGCKRSGTETPGAAGERPELSYIRTADVRAKAQLVSGWYGIEDGAWRWMAREGQAVLAVPKQAPLNFELNLYFPADHMKKAGGPITVSVLFDGQPFAEQTYAQTGGYALVKPVAPGLLASESVKVTVRLNRAVPPTGDEKRELGAVVSSFGFRK